MHDGESFDEFLERELPITGSSRLYFSAGCLPLSHQQAIGL